ncbi:MAG: hypothetical protein JRN08_04395 [Nitrososphaerota archaeon]|nr:hypothetical protein [Nitrososphaerota archaeon]
MSSIAIDSYTGTIYGSAGDSIIGISSQTGKLNANVSIGHGASDVLVNPKLNLIYAVGCNQQGLACDSIVSVVNGTSATLMNVTPLDSAYYATATIDETTGFVYVSGEGQLAALNPSGTVVFETYPGTCGPFIGMADDPAQNRVIMAPQNYDYILVYDGHGGGLLNMYSLPTSPSSILSYVAFNTATNETYVIDSGPLLTFQGVASTGNVNATSIGAGQRCLPV